MTYTPPPQRPLRSGALPSVNPGRRDTPADRGLAQSRELAREATSAWQDVMGDRTPTSQDREQQSKRGNTFV